MRYRFRALIILVVAGLVVASVLVSGATVAQDQLRVTPLTTPIALFCSGTNLSAFGFDKDGTTHFAWTFDLSKPPSAVVPSIISVANATLEPEGTAIPAPPASDVFIDQEGIRLRHEDDGRYSVLTTQWDGKQFLLFFHGCPDPGSLEAFTIDSNGTWIPFRLNPAV